MTRRAKKSDLNTQAYILRLPPELLSTIFLAYKDLIRHRVDFVASSSPPSTTSVTYNSSSCTIPQDNSIAHKFLTLASVCRSFRNIAYSTSQFWTHIVLALHPRQSSCPEIDRFSAEIRGLETWLSRSGRRYPLQIHLTYVSGPNPTVTAYQQSQENDLLGVAVDMIAAHCERWEEVALCLPWSCLIRLGDVMSASSLGSSLTPTSATQKRTQAISKAMPMLKKVTLFGEHQEYYGLLPPSRLIDAFAEARTPALEEICLSMFRQTSVIAPWSRLKRFEGHRMSINDVLAVLDSTPLLEECVLTSPTTTTAFGHWGPGVSLGFGLDFGSAFTSDLRLVTVPRLKSLTLKGSAAPLRHLTLPALETLALCMDGNSEGEESGNKETMDDTGFGEWGFAEAGYTLADVGCDESHISAADFLDLMRRSGCALRSLQLCVDNTPIRTLLGCLKGTPQLKELKLRQMTGRPGKMYRTSMAEAIEHLTPRAGRGTLVPLLECLEVVGCLGDCSLQSLIDMVWLRWSRGEGEPGCLERLLLEITEGQESHIRQDILTGDRMKDIVEQGMDIKIYTK